MSEVTIRTALGFLNKDILPPFFDYDEESNRGQSDTELADWLDNKKTRHPYYFHPYNAGPPWRPQIREVSRTPLPPLVETFCRQAMLRPRLGLFPEIHRAYVAADNRLLLWNYDNDNRMTELPPEMPPLESAILAVGLVVPRPEVFSGEIRYVLVVVTASELYLLPAYFTGDTWRGDMHLEYDATLVAPTDGLDVTKIVGTKEGRIFLASKDACLHEVDYLSAEAYHSSWSSRLGVGFTKRTRTLNHTGWRLPVLLHSLLGGSGSLSPFPGGGGLVDAAVDPHRELLYTLAEDGTLRMYRLADSIGGAPVEVGSLSVPELRAQCRDVVDDWQRLAAVNADVPSSRLFRDAQGVCPNPGPTWPLVSLHVVAPSESRRVHLVLVAEGGARFYLSTFRSRSDYNTAGNASSRSARYLDPGQAFLLVNIRLPPPQERTPGEYLENRPEGFSPDAAGESLVALDKAYYSHGVMIASRVPGPDSEGQVPCIAHDVLMHRKEDTDRAMNLYDKDLSHPTCLGMRESMHVLAIGDEVFAIGEEPGPAWLHSDMVYTPAGALVLQAGETAPLPATGAVQAVRRVRRAQDAAEMARWASAQDDGGWTPAGRGRVRQRVEYEDAVVDGVDRKKRESFPSLPSPELDEWFQHVILRRERDLNAHGKNAAMGAAYVLNEWATQHEPRGRRQFVLLAGDGVHRVEKLRPLDHLAWLLLHERARPADRAAFFAIATPREAACMCVSLYCGGVRGAMEGVGAHQDPATVQRASRRLQEAALLAFEHYGGEASYALNFPGERPQLTNFRMSPGAFGVLLYFTRVVRAIWSRSAFFGEWKDPASSTSSTGDSSAVPHRVLSRFHASELALVAERLSRLRAFLREVYRSVDRIDGAFPPPSPSTAAATTRRAPRTAAPTPSDLGTPRRVGGLETPSSAGRSPGGVRGERSPGAGLFSGRGGYYGSRATTPARGTGGPSSALGGDGGLALNLISADASAVWSEADASAVWSEADAGGHADARSMESRLVNSLFFLVDRACQTMEALRRLSEPYAELGLLLAQLPAGQQADARSMTIEDLVVTEAGTNVMRALLHRLTVALQQEPRHRRTFPDALAGELRAVAPFLFAQDEAHVTRAMVLLRDARVASDQSRKDALRAEALDEVVHASARWNLDHESLQRLDELCKECYTDGHFDGIVDMCTHAARQVAFGRREALTQQDIQTLNDLDIREGMQGQPASTTTAAGVSASSVESLGWSPLLSSSAIDALNPTQKSLWARRECYRIALSKLLHAWRSRSAALRRWALESASEQGREMPSDPAGGGAVQTEAAFSLLLDRCLAAPDALWQEELFRWIIPPSGVADQALVRILIRFDSPLLESYLRERCRNEEVRFLYFEAQNRSAEAARLRFAQAMQEPGTEFGARRSIDERLDLLSQAIALASRQSVRLTGHVSPSEQQRWQLLLRIGDVQRDMLEEVRQRVQEQALDGTDERVVSILAQLEASPPSAHDLLEVAAELDLHLAFIRLVSLACPDPGLRVDVAERVSQIVHDVLRRCELERYRMRAATAAIRETITPLGQVLCEGASTFMMTQAQVKNLVSELEEFALRQGWPDTQQEDEDYWQWAGWVACDLLNSFGAEAVRWPERLRIYEELRLEAQQGGHLGYAGRELHLHYLRAITALVRGWLESVRRPEASPDLKMEFVQLVNADGGIRSAMETYQTVLQTLRVPGMPEEEVQRCASAFQELDRDIQSFQVYEAHRLEGMF